MEESERESESDLRSGGFPTSEIVVVWIVFLGRSPWVFCRVARLAFWACRIGRLLWWHVECAFRLYSRWSCGAGAGLYVRVSVWV